MKRKPKNENLTPHEYYILQVGDRVEIMKDDIWKGRFGTVISLEGESLLSKTLVDIDDCGRHSFTAGYLNRVTTKPSINTVGE